MCDACRRGQAVRPAQFNRSDRAALGQPKNVWRTVRNEGISAHRTVRYHLADCPLHNMSTQLSFQMVLCVFPQRPVDRLRVLTGLSAQHI